MSRARDLGSAFSSSANLSSDSEVNAAMTAHNTASNGHVGRGITASRPASPAIGDLYFDTTLNLLLAYASTGWGGVAPVPNAPTSVSASIQSFGSASVSFTAPSNVTTASYTVTSSPGGLTQTGTSSPIIVSGLSSNTAYTFSIIATGTNGNSVASSASNSVTTPNPIIDYLVVAGGGAGGGSFAGGGGGAGGLRTATAFAVTPGTLYDVTVGAGGTANSNGSNSIFSTITSTGGGMGGSSFNTNAGTGGSGGGTASLNFASNGGAASPAGQGFRGGNSLSPSYGSPYGGTGGGGAGAAGADQPSSTGNNTVGGIGIQSSITGTNTYYAGGGGGGAAGGGAGAGANGGSGGGGKGGSGNVGVTAAQDAPIAGAANTGGGGGGTGYYQTAPAGGSGIVVLRYPDTYPNPASTVGSPTVINTGGYKIYKFNNTGSITF